MFSSIYPMDTNDYEDLTKALEKLKLNDASLIYEKDSSAALGFGFRCGFLGLLHLDVVQERLEREYDLSLILSAPSVRYRIVLNNDKEVWIDNPSFYPDPAQIKEAYEPYIKAAIMTPERYLGAVMELCRERLPQHKRTNQIVFQSSLPTTPTGKIQRHLVIERLGPGA